MAKSSKQVLGFLDDLARRCRPAARREFSDLEEFAGRKLERLGHGVLQRAAAGEPLQGLAGGAAPVFPAAQGAVGLVHRSPSGCTASRCASGRASASGIRACATTISPTQDGRIVAGFYLDPYSRAEKRSGAWMDECVIAKSLPAGTALPVAQLVCNFTAPVGARPLAADARRGDHAVPRVRPRTAPHADARGLSRASPASTAWPGTRWSCRASSWRTSSGAPRCCRSSRRT